MKGLPAAFHNAKTPAALLLELRALSAQQRGWALPSALPDDAAAVARGRKPLVGASSALSFACTACGACCRAYAASVLCDPCDFYRIARVSVSASGDSDSDSVALTAGGCSPLATHPSRFQRAVGLFELAALPPGALLEGGAVLRVGPALTLPVAQPRGTAPVVFLKPHGGACGFAVPHGRAPGGAFPEAPGGGNGGGGGDGGGGGGGRRRRGGGGGGLACSLGPAGMPLACSLYPLGAFFTAQNSGAQFFSVDVPGCEGLREPAPPGATAAAYLARAGVPPARHAAAEWWQRLATAWATSGAERAAAALLPRAAALRARARGGGRVPGWVQAAEAEAAAVGAPQPPQGAPADALPGPLLRHLRAEVARAWFEAPCDDASGGREWGEDHQRGVEEATKRVWMEGSAILGLERAF
jgi:hypothetical protein